VAADPREVRRPSRVAKEVAGPRGGGGKVEERVRELVVVVFGGDGGVDFDGEGKRESDEDDDDGDVVG